MIKRLHRIEGQVRGIEKMIEEDRYCIDVLQQISAVKAIDKVALGMLDDHVRHCMSTAATDQQRRDDMTTELTAAISRLVRS
ncbi:MAG: metal-sensitive transcriptional regulator [Chloroflexi bacterium]|nr:metal-sensitive transcriptional regulator [Chloroflexota bacterium]